jgi:hypothetical protein
MPDVKFRVPSGLSLARTSWQHYVLEIQEVVARNLSCRDYLGSESPIDPDGIDVFTTPYDEDSARLGAVFFLEITGYDYPDRMATIQDRLQAICSALSISLPRLVKPGEGIKIVSAMYYPIPEGCWASS